MPGRATMGRCLDAVGCHNVRADVALPSPGSRLQTPAQPSPEPEPEPEPDPDPSPDCRPPQDGPDKRCYLFRICLPAPFLFMFGRRQFSWRWMQLSCVGLLVAASFPGQQIWRIPASAYPRDFGFAFCPYSLPRLVLQPGGK